ncbi:MAG: hypothetical protein LBN06_10280 [Prevotellaceae bacterium]|nr:hypothetical protein [Prevotellaceae bacterium]
MKTKIISSYSRQTHKIVIIDDMQNLWGGAIAAAFLVFLPEILRFIGMPNALAANMRQIIYGGVLIFMIFRYSKGGSKNSPT